MAETLGPRHVETVTAILNALETPDPDGNVVQFGEGPNRAPLIGAARGPVTGHCGRGRAPD
uniref:Uncharacterized protein n=1 Tax=Candidatus Kentrum eta TaxID=2126337 RepID=A0A450VP68_9GAMM|nr:MAG: hypothetical protein BECKH772B_GA0070898_103703 [Candidatus Kentron sp. H]VFK04033.1 MAG: hypothetical protein BECKH772A_GA0070896_103743 [Candidatus Kentron sp. H]VFK06571.1 MAG: hypothetical protein BECKH772C_GA0070978_103593 [Candidatus Kentron sp. H]